MSDIPYPHKVRIVTVIDGSGGGSTSDLDAWGNPLLEPEDANLSTGPVVDAWVQAKGLRELSEVASLAETGDSSASHTVFMDPVVLPESAFLVTLAGGGQVAGTRHRVVYVRNPDGGTDHLEVDTAVVSRGTQP